MQDQCSEFQTKFYASEIENKHLNENLTKTRELLNKSLIDCEVKYAKINSLQASKNLLEKQLGISDLALNTKIK
jgi:hypothetical protein